MNSVTGLIRSYGLWNIAELLDESESEERTTDDESVSFESGGSEDEAVDS